MIGTLMFDCCRAVPSRAVPCRPVPSRLLDPEDVHRAEAAANGVVVPAALDVADARPVVVIVVL